MPVYTLTMLCAAALVLWVYHHDSQEKEPWWSIIVALLFGFVMMWLIGMADDFAIKTFQLTPDRIFPKAATIALIEEGGKLLSIVLLAFWILRKQFNDPMDGLIYGRMVGLGMAVEESLLYLSISPPTLETFGIEIVRLFAHSLMGGLVGFAIGIDLKPSGRNDYRPRLVLLCVALSTTMHFAWNVAAYGRQGGLFGRVLPMALMLTMMLLWKYFCSIAQERSRQAFAPIAPPPVPS